MDLILEFNVILKERIRMKIPFYGGIGLLRHRSG